MVKGIKLVNKFCFYARQFPATRRNNTAKTEVRVFLVLTGQAPGQGRVKFTKEKEEAGETKCSVRGCYKLSCVIHKLHPWFVHYLFRLA